MGLKIIYSKSAQQDLREIYSFISRGSLHYAREELRLIREEQKNLNTTHYRVENLKNIIVN